MSMMIAAPTAAPTTATPAPTTNVAPRHAALHYPDEVRTLASGSDKLVWAHWNRFIGGGGAGPYTGVDAKALGPLGPTAGFEDAASAATFVHDLAVGSEHRATGAPMEGGGFVSAAIVHSGDRFYPIELGVAMVGVPGHAGGSQGPATIKMTAKGPAQAQFGGSEVTLADGGQAWSPWGYRNYSKSVDALVVADSTGAVADVPREGRAHAWNTPNSGGISVD